MEPCQGSESDDIVAGDRFQMSIAMYNNIGLMGTTLLVRVKQILINPDGTKQLIVEHIHDGD